MSTKTVKLLLTNSAIPLTYEQVSRATIDNQDQGARLPSPYSGDFRNSDYGVAELIFAENVMPFAKGIYSVNYVLQANACPGPITTADQYIALRDIAENIRGFIPAKGGNYVFNAVTNAWTSVSSFAFVGTLVTRAYVAGRTLVCYEKNRIIEYDVGTGLFTTIALTFPPGLAITDIRGIGAASNYLLLFTAFGIYWSSPLNILDFNDTNAGAGTQVPSDIKGQITAILNVSGGFIVYTARNAIGAVFTNNAATPFVFKEITNAGGVASWEQVTPEADDTGHYIYGTNGLQLVGLNKAINIFPEIVDFLVGGQVETWNSSTKTVDRTISSPAFYVKLSFLAGRYLCISYGSGTTTFSYALIYDTGLKRWGKVKIQHTDAFMFGYTSGTGAYTYDTLPGDYASLVGTYSDLGLLFLAITAPKQGIAFLQSNGAIYVMVPNFVHTGDSGVAIFGHIQQRHGDKITLQAVELDGVKTVPAPVVTILSSVSGYSRATAVDAVLNGAADNNYLEYNKRVTGTNFDVVIEGTFVLSAALARVSRNGSR